MSSCLKLTQIFKNDTDFAWRLLEAQCFIHMNHDVTILDITRVSELYMKAIERLNTLQDQREKFFTQKMQQLMVKPFVIRCFNNENEGKKKKGNLESKRKQMQQILSHENEKSHPERLQHLIYEYGEKQKKIKSKIDRIMQDHQKSLQQRLKKRNSQRIDRLSYIESPSFQHRSSNQIFSDKKDKIYNPQSSKASTVSQFIQFNFD